MQEEKAATFTKPAATPHTFDGYGLVTTVDFQDMKATKVRIAKTRAINALRVKKSESTNDSKFRLMKVFVLWRERYVVTVRGLETFLSA